MSKNRGEIRTLGGYRTGYSGTEYAVRWNEAINLAQQEVGSILWDFLYRIDGTFSVTTGNTAFDISCSDATILIGKIDINNIFIGVDRLVEGSIVDIVQNPVATAGKPLQFKFANVNVSNLRKVYVGCPTADANYTGTFYFWRKISDLTADADTSIISTAYTDKPIFTYSCYIMQKFLEHPEADALWQEFMFDMNIMEQKMDFSGPSYTEIQKTIASIRKQATEEKEMIVPTGEPQ